MRPDTAVLAGTYPYDGPDVTTDWHVHDLHQVEYAFEGVVEVETGTARYVLPPQRAVWIPAGLTHRTTLRKVRTVSVFFSPAMMTAVSDSARVLSVEPVLREMIVYASRWPIDRETSDPAADAYFRTLAHLVSEWTAHEAPFHLPTATDPLVTAAMAHTEAHLDAVTLAEVCSAVAVSERTLRRRFAAATGMTWREYLLRCRLLTAMTLLGERDLTVLAVATRVGFDSASAFTRAFTRYAGETPSAYRGRTRATPSATTRHR